MKRSSPSCMISKYRCRLRRVSPLLQHSAFESSFPFLSELLHLGPAPRARLEERFPRLFGGELSAPFAAIFLWLLPFLAAPTPFVHLRLLHLLIAPHVDGTAPL